MSAAATISKGALVAPFLFVGAALAAWGSAQASPAIWSVSLASLAVVLASEWSSRWTITPLALAVAAFAAWGILHTAFLSRVYNPAGIFDPLFLLAGFAIGRTAGRETRLRCYMACVLLLVVLALWALGQLAFGSGRGHAHFETSNTLASALNLALAPAILALLYGAAQRWLVLLTGVLFAGVCATASRGGAIALVASLLIVIALRGTADLRGERIRGAALILLVAAACAALAIGASHWLPHIAGDAPFSATLQSAQSRLELYRLAWSTTTFGLGIGYLAFRYVLEVGRAAVPSYGENSFTYFVHNDYLQTLLELGIPGLAALIAIAVLAFRAGIQRRASEQEQKESWALFAGILTLAVHALIDFPLHVPLCLLLFGFGLGALDRSSAPAIGGRAEPAGQAQRLATLIVAAGMMVLLVRPVVAEAAAAYAMKKWLLGQTRDAAYGFELARRADPRDWRYQLYAGQFWFAQAAQDRQPEQARLAEQAFAAGMAANPLEPSSALGRAFTHLRYASILPAPATPSAIRSWAEQAIIVAPLNAAVRKEYEAILGRLPANP